MEEIIGYKGFTADLTNKYGQIFVPGVVYQKNTDLKFGRHGHGWHFCSRLEDTFRYFNSTRNNVYCKIVGSGNFIKVSNFAYNSSDMYVSEKIKIVEVLSRKQILEYALTCDLESLERMLLLYCFTKDELEFIYQRCLIEKETHPELLSAYSEFQTGDKETFKRPRAYIQ